MLKTQTLQTIMLKKIQNLSIYNGKMKIKNNKTSRKINSLNSKVIKKLNHK